MSSNSLEELSNNIRNMSKPTDRGFDNAFAVLDEDNDGLITKDELIRLLGKRGLGFSDGKMT